MRLPYHPQATIHVAPDTQPGRAHPVRR